MLVRNITFPLHVIAEGGDCHDLGAGDLLVHASLDLAGQADAVKLVHPFNDTLNQRSERGVVKRLGDADHIDAGAAEHGLVENALLLVAGKSTVFPHKDCVEGPFLLLGQRDHILKRPAPFGIAAGNTVLNKDELVRHDHVVRCSVIADQFQLTVKAVFILPLGRYTHVCGGVSHSITSQVNHSTYRPQRIFLRGRLFRLFKHVLRDHAANSADIDAALELKLGGKTVGEHHEQFGIRNQLHKAGRLDREKLDLGIRH